MWGRATAGLQTSANLVGMYVSLPSSQFINLILKVSYNRGADFMTCLAAVRTGSTDCGQGLATVLTNSPAAENVELKTGNRAVGSAETNQLMLLGNSLAGYIQTRSGHHVTFMIVVGNVPLTSPSDVQTVTDEQAQMVAPMYQDL
jgi:hypothetical protein